MSLCICCTKPPFAEIEPMLDRPGGRSAPLRVSRPTPDKLVVNPWPFDAAKVELAIPFRRVSTAPFASEEAFRQAYSSATIETFSCMVCSL
jgi:hypothetical protein